MNNEHSPSGRRKRSPLKIASYAGIVAGSIVLVCTLALLFFADPLVNRFIKPRIIAAVAQAYPADSIRIADMHYNVWKNRLECDSILLKTSTMTCSVASFSVSGIDRMKILMQEDFTPGTFTSLIMDARNIVLRVHQSQDAVRCGTLHVSVPDSEMTADSIKYYPAIDDEQFFAKNRFRQTRYRFDIPQLNIMGLDYAALLHGNAYSARYITLHDLFADILVNMDKPFDKNSPHPQMPNEALASMKEILKVDSVKIMNGTLNYSERYALNATPGAITFEKVNIAVRGIANHSARPETAVVQCMGLLMNSGAIKLLMEIPLTGKDFSMRYSGSLGTMDLTKLNTFIEPSEHQRIKSGIAQSATFTISVTSGRASGTLQLAYKDLSIAVLNKNNGSENGIFNRISTLLGKIFVIRGTNMPDEKGLMKIGHIQYTRNPKEYFSQFLWFTLRSSIADVVGFPPISPD